MKSELKELSPTQKQIHLEIDAESLKASYGRVSQRYAKRVQVPGFRKGFAPVDVVRMRFKEEIKSEVLQDVVPTMVAEAIREHGLDPLSEPHLHIDDQDNIEVNGSKPLSLHVHVEVMPEIETPKYDGIELVRRVKPVDDAEVDRLINERLKNESALMPVEGRPSEDGDTIVVDLEGRFDDTPDADPIEAKDLEITLGDEGIEPSFTENLVGLNDEEVKEFTVSYADSFQTAELAGKTVHYKATLKSIGRSEVPELNDEWAKSLDEGYESVADLKAKLKADLGKVSEADADAAIRNTAVAKMIEDNSFEVPGVLIENQARNLLNNFAQDMQNRGIDLKGIDDNFIQMAYGNMRQQAERDVRGAMLLDKVAEAEGVEVSDSEVNDEVTKIAEYYRVTPEDIEKSMEENGGLDNIRNNLRTRKSIEAIVAKAKITDGEWIDDNAAAAIASEPEAEDKPKKATKKKAAKKAE
jgi:trigger factor